MEKDTFGRFKNDACAIDKLVDGFYVEAMEGKDGKVEFEAFKKWALANPSVFIFFTGLTESIKRVLEQLKEAPKMDAEVTA